MVYSYLKMEEIIFPENIEKGPLFKGIDVTEVKMYTGPFPVIKPTKKLTEEEITELLKPTKIEKI